MKDEERAVLYVIQDFKDEAMIMPQTKKQSSSKGLQTQATGVNSGCPGIVNFRM